MLQSVFETSLVFVGGNVGEEEKSEIEGIIPVLNTKTKMICVCFLLFDECVS